MTQVNLSMNHKQSHGQREQPYNCQGWIGEWGRDGLGF